MLVTTVYLYNQNVNLKIKADTDKEHWGYEMYNHPIKVYKGIDNTIQLSLKNDNQKSLTITDKTITFNILDNVSDSSTDVVPTKQGLPFLERLTISSITALYFSRFVL